jgi:hypothetical protein
MPPIQLVSGSLHHGGKAVGGVRLTTSLHLVPGLRMSTAIPPSLYMPSCRAEENRNVTFIFSMPNVNTVLSEKLTIIHHPCIQQYYYYYYSALGLVWAGTRAQSGDRYGSGTLHPGQVLRGSLPLLSPIQQYTDTIYSNQLQLYTTI